MCCKSARYGKGLLAGQVFARLWQDGKTVMKSMGGVGSPLNQQWGSLACYSNSDGILTNCA